MFKYIDPKLNANTNRDNLKKILSDTDLPGIEAVFRNLQTWTFVSDPTFLMRKLWHIEDKQQLLDLARKNIAELNAFGLSEEMDKTFELFNMQFRWSLSNDARVGSTSHIELEVDDELTELIEKNNELDTELYSWAKEVFFERYNRLVRSPPRTSNKC